MENSSQIAKRFKEVLLDGKWIANTNYKDLLSKISWDQAVFQLGSLNTIADLTFHINYYIAGILNVFKGGQPEIKDKFSFDLPQIESEEDWDKLCNQLWKNAEQFFNHITLMSEQKLEDGFVKKEYGSYRRNIEGVIEHSYYHLGQISLIKKMISESKLTL